MRRIGMRLALLVLVLSARTAAADYVYGVSDYVEHAEAVAIGRAQTVAEERAFPPPAGGQRILVHEVLVGVWFDAYIEVAGRPLAPGGGAIALIAPRELGPHPELAVAPPPAREAPRIWALGPADTLPAELAPHGDDGGLIGMQGGSPVSLADLRAIAATVRPREVGLTAQLVDAAVVHPGTGAPDIEALAAIYDLARDVPRLAALLESPSQATRDGAAKRLTAIGAVPAATGSAPADLAAWRARWVAWHASRAWPVRNYPAVPSPVHPPAVQTPAALLAALDTALVPATPASRGAAPGAVFATAMRGWLDSGVVRDRELRGATTTDASPWPGADTNDLTFNAVVFPRLATLFDRKARPADRLAALAALALHAHADRFAAERAAAAQRLGGTAPCDALVRAAAYWEIVDNYTPGPAHAAWARLAACDAPDAIAFLEAAYRIRMDAPVVAAVGTRVTAGDKAFAARLVDHVRAGGARTWQFVRILLGAGDRSVVPVVIAWLGSGSPDVRLIAAGELERARAPEALLPLLAALRAEKSEDAFGAELSAIADIADARALPDLLAAAGAHRDRNRISIANGLARIRDKRALESLALLAETAGADEQGAMAAINAYCWISAACPGHASYGGGTVDPAYIRDGLAAIAKRPRPRTPPAAPRPRT